jgi:RNA polymerase sigma-70 factor (ECF subfamily)
MAAGGPGSTCHGRPRELHATRSGCERVPAADDACSEARAASLGDHSFWHYPSAVAALNEPMEEPPDAALVTRMAQGDRSAVAVLYQRHAAALFGYAQGMLRHRQEAEDLIHDVFLEAWRRSGDYSAERGSVRAWLLVRVRSRALDRLKSAGRSRVVSEEQQPSAVLPLGVGDERRVRELLSRMPEAQQEVIVLGYFEGLSTVEIAERLQIPAGTVKSRTRAALGALRTVLGLKDE